MPRDDDEPPTMPKLDAAELAIAAEEYLRKAERAVTVATTPAPLEYAQMAALLSTVPRMAVERDDLGEFKLDEAARALIAAIDGKRSVGEIAARVDSPNVLTALTELERRGIITLASTNDVDPPP